MKSLEMKIWILTSLMITMIPNLPEPLKKTLETTMCLDADHTHDIATSRSITALLAVVENNLAV